MDTNEEDRSHDGGKYSNLTPLEKDVSEKDSQAHQTHSKELGTTHMTINETHHITESTETKSENEGKIQIKITYISLCP